MAVDLAVSIPTVVGSILSTLASGFVLSIFAISPKNHFRHWLIFNLTLADFINATNNTVSGLIVLSRGHDLYPGPGCRFNGWIGQFSVQAIDFSIFAIAMVALWIVQRPTIVSSLSWISKVTLCASVWIVPLVTSTTALCLDILGPVSGNWCWIEPRYLGLRYALGHGWRIGIVLITAVTYIVVFIVVKRRYQHLRLFPNGDTTTSGRNQTKSTEADQVELTSIRLDTTVTVQSSDMVNTVATIDRQPEVPSKDRLTFQVSSSADQSLPSRHNTSTTGSRGDATQQRDKKIRYTEVRRVMLLNGYPAFYILLWIPGLLNRLFESLGHHYRWLQILQASTQFIGLANALTYSYNEGFRRQIRSLLTRQRRSYHEQL
ncbi:hypothetical protein ETB97_000617 [Aspergillus alliaceus]|uniref:Glucose receptor Git3-like N-terminal domain-containing protein n=1 Tax=Petromyces alliaceus TaxID=209559 RepID=A0A8H6E6D8_PETAA|nr:hypothetical protein ETB97_000617 [Aspergillus burnettii]